MGASPVQVTRWNRSLTSSAKSLPALVAGGSGGAGGVTADAEGGASSQTSGAERDVASCALEAGERSGGGAHAVASANASDSGASRCSGIIRAMVAQGHAAGAGGAGPRGGSAPRPLEHRADHRA